jgi:hypothetical protein
MKEEKKPTEAERKPEETPAGEPKADPKVPKKAPYVFKILPADPKNAFDFEDVADK